MGGSEMGYAAYYCSENASAVMFTPGIIYPVVRTLGNVDVIRDNKGCERCILPSDPRFITSNHIRHGQPLHAYFEGRF
jgi:hypothetical protein